MLVVVLMVEAVPESRFDGPREHHIMTPDTNGFTLAGVIPRILIWFCSCVSPRAEHIPKRAGVAVRDAAGAANGGAGVVRGALRPVAQLVVLRAAVC